MCIKRINAYFKTATRADVNELLSKIILSERQTRIFEMFYLKRQNIGFIADSLFMSKTQPSIFVIFPHMLFLTFTDKTI